jgi:hypothetical protein
VTEQPGKPEPSKQRVQSRIGFPYFDLDDAIAIARAIYNNAGNQCTVDQLAGYMKQTMISGAFREKVRTAKIFGIVDGNLRLTDIGRLIVDPQQERVGRAQAFLAVPLYAAIFEKYKGGLLPPDVALEREMIGLGISEKQKAKARQAFQRSAKQAGFFDQGRERLVLPSGVTPAQSNRANAHNAAPSNGENRGRAGVTSSSTSGPPAKIKMLLGVLPGDGEAWSDDEQDTWLELMRDAMRSSYRRVDG